MSSDVIEKSTMFALVIEFNSIFKPEMPPSAIFRDVIEFSASLLPGISSAPISLLVMVSSSIFRDVTLLSASLSSVIALSAILASSWHCRPIYSLGFGQITCRSRMVLSAI